MLHPEIVLIIETHIKLSIVQLQLFRQRV